MDQKMTVEDVLKVTADILREIQLPVELSEQIGIPVMRAIHNIDACVQAIVNGRTEEKTEEEESE